MGIGARHRKAGVTLDQKIQLWNAIGTWVAGIATFAAVITSLYLARQSSRVKMKAVVGLRLVIGRGAPREEVLQFSVTNQGDRPVTISNVGWVIGKGKNQRHALQLFGSAYSASIPKTLAHGERADFLISFTERPDWLDEFSKKFVMTNDPKVLRTLTAEIRTSVDQTVKVKPEALLLQRIAEAYKSPA